MFDGNLFFSSPEDANSKCKLTFEDEMCNFWCLAELGDGPEMLVFEGSPRFSDEEMERSSNFLEGKLLDSCSLQTFLKDYQRRMLDGLSKKSYNGLKLRGLHTAHETQRVNDDPDLPPIADFQKWKLP